MYNLFMKSNFQPTKKNNNEFTKSKKSENEILTKEDLEEYLVKAGAAGSFMVFRSSKKDDEMGIDEL